MHNKEELKKHIVPLLEGCAIFDEQNQDLADVEIFEIRDRYPNGTLFAHKNGNTYSIIYFRAFTKKGFNKISDLIKGDAHSTIDNIKEVIEENRLWKYVHHGLKAYSKWKVGDKCNVGVVYDLKLKDFIVDFFNVPGKTQ